MVSQDAKLSMFEADFKQHQSEMTNKIDTMLKAITDRIAGTLPSDTVKNLKLGTYPISSSRSYLIMDPQCSTQIHSSIDAITIHPKQPDESQVNEPEVEQKEDNPKDTNSNPHPQPDPLASITTEQEDDGEVMFIEIIQDDDEPQNEDPGEGEGATMEETVVEYFDTFPTRNELTYHRHVHIEKAYIDLNSPLNIMTRMMYNWIMRRKLDPRENANGGISNFTGRIKGMHVFVGNFTCVVDFMIVEDISSIIDPRSRLIFDVPSFRAFLIGTTFIHDNSLLDDIKVRQSLPIPLVILLFDSEFEHSSHTLEMLTSFRNPFHEDMPTNSTTTLTCHLIPVILLENDYSLIPV
ncbi:hypothetical protein Tco_0241231 [Tanacetum coccineum]